MPINPSLLVTSNVLQDVITDITGTPAAGGVITLYKDNSRTTLKNWYYLSGSPGFYNFVTLPNPMTLGAYGQIVDVNGNDALPYFYPFSETDNSTPQPYYITCVDSLEQNIFTRQNFPYQNENVDPQPTINATNQNLIINNNFWRNATEGLLPGNPLILTSPTLNPSTLFYQTVVCPSQHDGFASMSDIQFIKNASGTSTDTVFFTKFTGGTIPFNPGVSTSSGSDITPEYYLTHVTGSNTGGETIKGYSFPIALRIKSLESTQCTLTFWAQNNGVTNSITAYIYQFCGTGTAATSQLYQIAAAQPLNNTWTKYTIQFTMPSASLVTVGSGGDDGLFLFLGLPLPGTQTSINLSFALPSVYISTTVPTNAFQSYDTTTSVICSPRTGDVRMSVNAFGAPSNFGWVPMNDGSLAQTQVAAFSGYYARANYDTWPLYNLLWNLAKPFDSGSNSNPICQMYTPAAAPTNFSSSAYTDFNNNQHLGLTKMFGRVLLGTVPVSALMNNQALAVTFSNVGGYITATSAIAIPYIYVGMPVNVITTGTLPNSLVANAIYYVTNILGLTFKFATTFSNAIMNNSSILYVSTSGSGCSIIQNTTGTFPGEQSHLLSANELALHTHTGSMAGVSNGNFVMGSVGGAFGTAAGNNLTGVANTGNNVITSSGVFPHNNLQNSGIYNIYIKL